MNNKLLMESIHVNIKKDIKFMFILLTKENKKLLNKDDFPLKNDNNEIYFSCSGFLPVNSGSSIDYSFSHIIRIKTYKDFIKYKKKSKKEIEEFIIKKYNEIY